MLKLNMVIQPKAKSVSIRPQSVFYPAGGVAPRRSVFYLGFVFRVGESKFRVGAAHPAHPVDKSLPEIDFVPHPEKLFTLPEEKTEVFSKKERDCPSYFQG
jgi:hypothetical protein